MGNSTPNPQTGEPSLADYPWLLHYLANLQLLSPSVHSDVAVISNSGLPPQF